MGGGLSSVVAGSLRTRPKVLRPEVLRPKVLRPRRYQTLCLSLGASLKLMSLTVDRQRGRRGWPAGAGDDEMEAT